MAVHSIHTLHAVPAISLRAGLSRAWASLAAMVHARRTRLMLSDLDDHLLADIGVGRGEAMTEASRPMWDLAPRRR